MDSEIRAIMAQYMPLDSQAEIPNHVNDEQAWKAKFHPSVFLRISGDDALVHPSLSSYEF